MSRLTLARAAGIVGVFAVGFGAMRAATDEGERIVFALTLAVHSAGLLGTLQRRGADPAWAGFCLFGWVFFLATTTDFFDGPSGNTSLPASDLASAAFAIAQPGPKPPVVDGVVLGDDEPDKMTATDAMLKAHEAYKVAVQEWSMRQTHVGAIADLLASILAGLVGAWLGPRLAPRPAEGSPPPVP